METRKQKKRLPYGSSNFESVRTENYVYIDKTRFIELLENENNRNLFFTLPRKFGKSLFFSMLSHYYDVKQADKFEQLFGDLYIGKHPTPRHNNYIVLNLDFSGLKSFLVNHDMTFYAFYFLITIYYIQGIIINPFNALTVYDSMAGFPVLLLFYTYVST